MEYNWEDIQELLLQFGERNVHNLDGKVVELFMLDSFCVAGFRVAEHLKQRRAG